MKAVIQRVSRASVRVQGADTQLIGRGFMILLGVERGDTPQDGRWLAQKISAMRVFGDDDGKMNLSLTDIAGEALVVSQFTLLADTKKGNRPSFNQAAPPKEAVPLYESFVQQLSLSIGKDVPTGQFGAAMQVEIVNEGPVTIIINSRNRG